jgi:hypothetical protein
MVDTPSPAPVIPPLNSDPLPQISYGEAESRKAELFGNSEWFNRYMAGDITAKREYDQIVAGLTAAPPAPANEREAMLDQLKRSAVIAPDVAQEVLDGRPASSAERESALKLKEHLFSDEGWIANYNKGDLRARQQKAYIDLILSKPVRDNPA